MNVEYLRDQVPDLDALPLGVPIATCTLSGASQIPEATAGVPLGCSPHEHAFGDDAPGRALVLQYVERLPEAIRFCASQGSFDDPDELLRSTFRHGRLR